MSRGATGGVSVHFATVEPEWRASTTMRGEIDIDWQLRVKSISGAVRFKSLPLQPKTFLT
jgi:hypothetical protein